MPGGRSELEGEYIRAILDQMPAGVIVGRHPTGELIFHNKEANRILGHPPIPAQDYKEYGDYGGIHPDGSPYLAEEYPASRALSGEAVHREEMLYRRGDGAVASLLVDAAPVHDAADAIIATVVTFSDVSDLRRATEALRESEERFRAMADNLPLIVWMHDAEGNQAFVNRTFCEFFGVTRAEMIEHRWQILMHPEDAESYRARFVAAVHERTEFEADVRVKRADGEWRWIRSWAQPRFGYEHEYLGHVGTSADVTEQKLAERVLRRSKTELETLVDERTAELRRQAARLRELSMQVATARQRERKRLAVILHDDLQQHLVAAKFKLSQAQGAGAPGELNAGLAEVVEMINDAIDSSRDLSQELRPSILHQHGLIPALRWLADETERRYGISVAMGDPPDELGSQLDEDRSALLYQSVQELVFNVVKHAGTDTLYLSVYGDDEHLGLRVCDKGAGFDVEAVHEGDGGLGLFSVEERLRDLGGSMHIDSAPGEGTTIVIDIPVATSGATDDSAAADDAVPDDKAAGGLGADNMASG